MAKLHKIDKWQQDFQTQLKLADHLAVIEALSVELKEFEEEYEGRLEEPQIAKTYAEMKKKYQLSKEYMAEIKAGNT